VLAVSTLLTTHTLIGLASYVDYQFQVRATNIYGAGPFSSIKVIRTSQVPDTMVPVSTLSAMATFIILWEDPPNGGEPIDEYHLQILTPAGLFTEDPTCTGDVLLGASCLFDHLYLIATYNF
jgi:hypothetical protein